MRSLRVCLSLSLPMRAGQVPNAKEGRSKNTKQGRSQMQGRAGQARSMSRFRSRSSGVQVQEVQVQGQRRSRVNAGPGSRHGQVNAGAGQRRSRAIFGSRPSSSRNPSRVRGISVLPFNDDTARVRIGSSSWRATSKRRYGAPSCVASAHRPSDAHSVGGQGTNETKTTEADTKFSGTTGSHATRRAMAQLARGWRSSKLYSSRKERTTKCSPVIQDALRKA